MITAEAPGRDCAIVVFARRPRPGHVKTRLARAVGAAQAARIYAALLERSIRVAEAAPLAPRILMPAGCEDLAYFRTRYARRGWRVRAQAEGDLGRRMACATTRVLAGGQRVVLIGSDVADCRANDLEAAANALAAGADAAIAPAADGGYWLIALARPIPGLFARLRWGHGSVYAQTLLRLRAAGVDFVELPSRHDVDTVRDLRSMRGLRTRTGL